MTGTLHLYSVVYSWDSRVPIWSQLDPWLSTSLDLTPKRGASPDLLYTILLADQITDSHQETSFHLTLDGTFIIAPDRF
jgi:hypothetical protein